MSDLEKCTLFDSVRCKQPFWAQICEQTGLTHREAQSLYRNFRKKTLYHRTKQVIENTIKTNQIATRQQLFASQFALQLSLVNGKALNVSDLEKCVLFDGLQERQRVGILAKVGALMRLESEEVGRLYGQFKKDAQ